MNSIFESNDGSRAYVKLTDALRALEVPSNSPEARLKKNVEYVNSFTGESFKTNVLAFRTTRDYATHDNDGNKRVTKKIVNISFSKNLAEQVGHQITREWFDENYKTAQCSLAEGKDDWLVISAEGFVSTNTEYAW